MKEVGLVKCNKNLFNFTSLFLNFHGKMTGSMKLKSEKINFSERSENVLLFESKNKLQKSSLNCWLKCFS